MHIFILYCLYLSFLNFKYTAYLFLSEVSQQIIYKNKKNTTTQQEYKYSQENQANMIVTLG